MAMAIAERFGEPSAPSRRERYLSLAVEAYEMAVRAPEGARQIAYLKVAREWLELAQQCGAAQPPVQRRGDANDGSA